MKLPYFKFTCLLFVIIAGVLSMNMEAQVTKQGKAAIKWTQAAFNNDVFIENAGQFSNEEQKDVVNKIVYYSRKGNMHLYFTPGSLVYRYDSLYTDKEEGEGDERENVKLMHKFLRMEWDGANTNATIEVTEPVSNYFTYGNPNDKTGKSGIKAHAWRKLVYHNLYNGIDVEFFYPEKGGIEYNVIVRPGADISKFKMHYSDDTKFGLNENNIVIKSPFIQLTDHAPIANTLSGSVPVSFAINDKTISFNTGNYDKSKTLTIDPWISSPGFAGANEAFDLDIDLNGNVYVYGSTYPYQISKFNNAGVPQWTYTSTFAYVYTGGFSFYGGMCVDGHSGSSFISEGFDASSSHLIKINTLGIQSATNPGNTNYQEIWRMKYNSCEQKGVMLGGGTTSNTFQIADLDTTLATLSPTQIVVTSHLDFSMLALDNAGDCYVVDDNNNIDKANIATFSPSIFSVPSGYGFGELTQPRYIPGTSGYPGGNGFNGLVTSPNFLYSYDGQTLKKWNSATGTFIASTSVQPFSFRAGGITVDNCDDIFLGVGDSAKQFNVSLARINEFKLPDSVFDMKLSGSNILYACGKGFVCAVDPGLPNPVTASFTAPTLCTSCDGTATANVNCGTGPYTYTWSNGATTQTISSLCAGSYTVTVQGANCMLDTASVIISGKLGYTATVVDTNPNCSKSKGNITAYPTGGTAPYTYNWSNGATTQSDTGLVAGTYNCNITDNGGCVYSLSVTLVNPSSPSITIAPITDSICKGFNASLTAKGGKTYTWMPGSLSGSTVTVSPATTTTYTVLALDSNGCSGSATATVIVNPPPSITVTPPSDSICKGSSVTLKASGGNSYTWKPNTGLTCYNCASPTATPLVNTTWTVTGTDSHGCIDSTTVTVIVKPIPVGTIITKPDTVCIGDSATLIAGGGGSYVWTFSGQTSDSVKVGPVTTTTYNLQVTKDGCTSVTSAKVVVVGSVIPTIAIAKDSICKGDSTTITAAGGSSYKWLPGGAITSVITVKPSLTTTYSCIITTACGIDTLSEKLTVLPFPIISLSPDTTICTGSSAVLKATGGGTYKWTPGGATTSTITVTPGSTQTYSVSVSNGTCAKDTSITVVVNNPPPIDLTPDQVVCQGATVYFADTAKGAFKYLWSNGATTSSITVVPSGNTTYTLVVSNGCLDSAVAHVKVNISGLSACCDTTIITGDTVTIRATGSGNYLWAPDPSSLSCYTCPDPVASPTVTTTYTVTGTDSNGCVADRLVTIFVECIDFTVPNVFTPNNDGINDDLVIKALNPSSYTINIYDRWGKEVYTSNDATKYWNGDLLNTQYLVPDGVYYYIIKATCGGNNYDKHGFVQVIGGK